MDSKGWSRTRLRLFQLSLVLLPPTFNAKILLGQLQLTSNVCELFISKFSFSPRTIGHMSGTFGGHGKRFKADENGGMRHRLELGIFGDDAWAKYLAAVRAGSLCSERMALATSRRELKPPEGGVAYNKEARKLGKPVAEFVIDEVFVPRDKSHYYYFLVADCSLEFYPAHPPTLDYTLHLTNGGSELPADEDGLTLVNGLALLALIGACAIALFGLRSQVTRFGRCHLSTVAITIATVSQAVGVTSELLHLLTYASDGKGMRFRHGRLPLDFLSDTAQNISEVIVVIVVLSVANGWTLIDGTFREMRKVAGLCISVLCVQFGLELIGRRYHEDFSSFHDHDHWPGVVLMILRISCCAVTINGTSRTLRKLGFSVFSSGTTSGALRCMRLAFGVGCGDGTEAAAGGSSAAAFIVRFSFWGCAWLLAFPAAVLFVAPAFPPYHRHCVVESAAILCQGGALVALLVLFLGVGDSGKAFLKASTLSAMGSLGGVDIGEHGSFGGGSAAVGNQNGALSSSGLGTALKAVRRKVAVD